MPYFDVVIPLIPQHDSQMKRIFSILSRQNVEIGQVILARSETWAPKKYLEYKFRKSAHLAGLKGTITVAPIRSTNADGSNRNRGWKLCQNEFIVFLDADDNYSDDMLEVIYKCIESTGADVIIHNFESEDPEPEDKSLNFGSSEPPPSEPSWLKKKIPTQNFLLLRMARAKNLKFTLPI